MIALITPTGGRQRQIELCALYMKRQDYKGEVVWIIVDDCEPRTTDFIKEDFLPSWQIVKVRPEPLWTYGANTQGRNLAAGISRLLSLYPRKDIEAVYFIEDDDYYKPCYLREMRERIRGYHLAGETHTIYYNVALMRWIRHENKEWSSLFQTVFTLDIVKTIYSTLQEKFIDYVLFRLVQRKNLFRASDYAIGIKGLSGRAGIGAGHGKIIHMAQDPEGEKLKELLGADASLYYKPIETLGNYRKLSENESINL
jgi:hypothetical protein